MGELAMKFISFRISALERLEFAPIPLPMKRNLTNYVGKIELDEMSTNVYQLLDGIREFGGQCYDVVSSPESRQVLEIILEIVGVDDADDIEYRDILTRSREDMESILFHNMVSAVAMVGAERYRLQETMKYIFRDDSFINWDKSIINEVQTNVKKIQIMAQEMTGVLENFLDMYREDVEISKNVAMDDREKGIIGRSLDLMEESLEDWTMVWDRM